MTWPLQEFMGQVVSTHSIRYRILKVEKVGGMPELRRSFNPFDPIQDTERRYAITCGSGQI